MNWNCGKYTEIKLLWPDPWLLIATITDMNSFWKTEEIISIEYSHNFREKGSTLNMC
jgi:hypothetical protein